MGNSSLRIHAFWQQSERCSTGQKVISGFDSFPARRAELLQEETFHSMLTLERRRAERSRDPFVLILLDASAFVGAGAANGFMSRLASVLWSSTRETDLVGWYQKGVMLGVIFTEIGLESKNSIKGILHSKVLDALQAELGREVSSKLVITVQLFPEDHSRRAAEPIANRRFFPDLEKGQSKKHFPRVVKRAMDLIGSILLLVLTSPLLALIAIAIKLTSKGPVIFQQVRLGEFGVPFRFLKFRTMHAGNDPKIHQEYVRRFIAGQTGSEGNEPGKPAVYKLTNDARVTPLGRFLRKTSLDEFPQFWNVLRGEMSLVGPRPPVPYEFEVYDIWHRRRVLEVKPGVTGLWQVSGRSRLCFDDMVRLDLRYSQKWSLWLDLRILIATFRAVLRGEGAY